MSAVSAELMPEVPLLPAPVPESPVPESPVLIREITPRGILSFGPDTPPLALGPLNVLIGPNGSGKSNLLDVIGLMRAVPRDFRPVMRKSGGVQEWIWKGDPDGTVDLTLDLRVEGVGDVRHQFSFARVDTTATVTKELVDTRWMQTSGGRRIVYAAAGGALNVTEVGDPSTTVEYRALLKDGSLISQYAHPQIAPDLMALSKAYEDIHLFREWQFGRMMRLRQPQPTDARTDRLEEDFSNLGLVLNRLTLIPSAKRAISKRLGDLYEGLDDFGVRIDGGTVQINLTEGDATIPATRLSDGTLRYLCLLAILCDPTPPPLICLEEPELGMHPDLIPGIADMLVDASQRTQLIVTTHSEMLVDALTHSPEAIVVCEKRQGQTSMTRLSADELGIWLVKYRLGELWMRGQIGGTRW